MALGRRWPTRQVLLSSCMGALLSGQSKWKTGRSMSGQGGSLAELSRLRSKKCEVDAYFGEKPTPNPVAKTGVGPCRVRSQPLLFGPGGHLHPALFLHFRIRLVQA